MGQNTEAVGEYMVDARMNSTYGYQAGLALVSGVQID